MVEEAARSSSFHGNSVYTRRRERNAEKVCEGCVCIKNRREGRGGGVRSLCTSYKGASLNTHLNDLDELSLHVSLDQG